MPEKRILYESRAGFDNAKYVRLESNAIIERASKFRKFYLEIGGKLIDDYHAARVLPGYAPDAKMSILAKLARKRGLEFLLCISARDLQSGKKTGTLGISYADFSLRMIESIEKAGFGKPIISINLFSGEKAAKSFGSKMKAKGYAVYFRGLIAGYPKNLSEIISRRGFGKKPFIKTSKPIVVVVGAGPGSGKMATCLAMVYQDYMQGIDSGYAKLETFPVWNLPLSSRINKAYEAATADLGDCNLLDPFHLKAYGVKAVNYNRDVASFPIIRRIVDSIISLSNFMRSYRSPTDMGINLVRGSITDLELCEKAARAEIKRRHRKG